MSIPSKFLNSGKPHPLLDKAFRRGQDMSTGEIPHKMPPIMEFKDFEEVEKWAKQYGLYAYRKMLPTGYFLMINVSGYIEDCLVADHDLDKFLKKCDEYRAKEGSF